MSEKTPVQQAKERLDAAAADYLAGLESALRESAAKAGPPVIVGCLGCHKIFGRLMPLERHADGKAAPWASFCSWECVQKMTGWDGDSGQGSP